MVDTDNIDATNVRETVNDIAAQWEREEELPAEVTWSDINTLCEILYDDIIHLIVPLHSGTHLNNRQAQAWVLFKEGNSTKGNLTREAVWLVFSAPSNKFGIDNDPTEADHVPIPAVVRRVDRYYNSAVDEFAKAQCLVAGQRTLDPDIDYEYQQITSLEHSTVHRLENRSRPSDETLDDIVTRLLDRFDSVPSLEEAVLHYLTTRGTEHVEEILFDGELLGRDRAKVKIKTDSAQPVPDAVAENGLVGLGNHVFDLEITEYDSQLEGNRSTICFFDSEAPDDAEQQVKDGIAEARDMLVGWLDERRPGWRQLVWRAPYDVTLTD